MNNSQVRVREGLNKVPTNVGSTRNNGVNSSRAANGNSTNNGGSITNKASAAASATSNKAAEIAGRAGDWWGSLGGLTKVFILVGFILLIGLAIYAGIKAAKYNQEKAKKNPVIISEPRDARSSASKVDGSKIQMSDSGFEFTYSMWILIDEWSYRYGYWKHIFHRGSADAETKSPGLWFYPKTNSLHARISTNDNDSEGCDISNIPLQSWVHIAWVLNNRTVDIYMNGKLERSCLLKGVPKTPSGDLYLLQNGGFSGFISGLRYFNYALSPNEIDRLSSGGPMESVNYKVVFSSPIKVIKEKSKEKKSTDLATIA